MDGFNFVQNCDIKNVAIGPSSQLLRPRFEPGTPNRAQSRKAKVLTEETASNRAILVLLIGRRHVRRSSLEITFLAHGSSSLAEPGRAVKISRRLGVSPGPFGSNGPVIDTWYIAGLRRGWR